MKRLNLQRWMPRTLFGRLAVVVIVTLLLSQWFAWGVLRYYRQNLVAGQLSEQVLDTLSELEGQLEAVPEAQRAQWLRAYNRPYGPNLYPLSEADPPADNNIPAQEQAIVRQLQADQLPIHAVRVQRQPNWRLWLQVDVLERPYWLSIPLGRIRNERRWPLLVGISSFTLFAMLGASFFVWRLNRPLRALGMASKLLAEGQSPPLLVSSGPQELRLLTDQFNQMVTSLRDADDARRLMLAGISHDLRTPLTRMRLAVEMMHDDSLRDGMLGDLQDMERIVQQFMIYIGGGPKERAEVTDLHELLRPLPDKYPLGQLQLQLAVEALPRLTLQPLAMSRLLGNLLDNAFRYGAPPVIVQTGQDAQQVWLQIRDHGQGIPEAEWARLLQPFERGNAARGGDGGSGLGLAIVARIAREQGAQLRLAQADEGGLLVELRWPRPA
ncbi:ATP-binding protein [Leeia aquatica]|uniref:histidine kinase n=1 Tax=Leeia aquatica TaxID=2725557 RepID=A0A847S8V0_9NEIS|nr:ATP-binding protein [Leeia aquatica]NLR76414.1 HAMP domain-containing protein [Leeia aquatica]